MVMEESMKSKSFEIGSLFSINRFPSGIYFLFAVVYFPIGVILAICRIFIGFQTFMAACILPKFSYIRQLVLRVMYATLGLIVWCEEENNDDISKCLKENSPEKEVKRNPAFRIYVANFSSTLDHLAVDLVRPCYTPSVWDFSPILTWFLGYIDEGAKKGRETLIQNTQKLIKENKSSILSFPEGASTNGRVGLLKFSTWPFSLNNVITPILITLKRPFFADISPSVLGGRWWIDLFWFLFVPYTSFNIRILKSQSQKEDESLREFADRIQSIIAKALKVETSQYTSVDKFRYAKEKLSIEDTDATIRVLNRSLSQASLDIDMNLMIQQVQEVLPDATKDLIHAELVLTNSIDATIVNLLEKSSDLVDTSKLKCSSLLSKPISQKIPVKHETEKLSNNLKSKTLTLKERKELLYETARQKYLQRNDLL